MSEQLAIKASVRTETGKSAARRSRREGKVPGVIYSKTKDTTSLYLDYADLKSAVMEARSGRAMITLAIEADGDSDESTVIIKDYQIDPVKRTLLHVDFFEVDLSKPIEITVNIMTEGKPTGVEAGGILQLIRREVLVSALPHMLPEQLVIDVSELEIGQTVHVGDLDAPEGVTILTEGGISLATVVVPKAIEEEVVEEELEEGEEGVEVEAAEVEAAEDSDSGSDSDSEDSDSK